MWKIITVTERFVPVHPFLEDMLVLSVCKAGNDYPATTRWHTVFRSAPRVHFINCYFNISDINGFKIASSTDGGIFVLNYKIAVRPFTAGLPLSPASIVGN
jgi:hypothetical protein